MDNQLNPQNPQGYLEIVSLDPRNIIIVTDLVKLIAKSIYGDLSQESLIKALKLMESPALLQGLRIKFSNPD